MYSLVLCSCIFLLIQAGMVADSSFVFNGKSLNARGIDPDHLEKISSPSLVIVSLPFTSSPINDAYTFSSKINGNISAGYTENKLENLSRTINARIEPDNVQVHDLGLALAAEHSGDHTIDQVCEIYSYLKYGNNSRKPWSYVDDPRGLDYFNYASESLSAGGASGSAGAGDCDDFAILMSSLVESIGGTTRIILAHNNSTGSHAYAEVYLGQLNAQNSQVANIIKWLEIKYNTDKIFTHVDTDSKDVWLNLDWSADHPGGPIFPADRYDVLWIRDRIRKISLNLPEKSNHPPELIGLTSDIPSPQVHRTAIIWTAEANDSDNDQILYRFFLNGYPVSKWMKENKWIWMTNDTHVRNNTIEVRVKDEEHSDPDRFDNNKTTSFIIIAVHKKPVITGLYADKTSPQEVGATVTWTVESDDPENDPLLYRFYVDGKPLTNWSKLNELSWQTNETYIGNNQIEVQVRDGNHSDPDGYDYHKSSDFAIVAPKSQSRSSDTLNFDELFFIIILLGIPFYLIFRKL